MSKPDIALFRAVLGHSQPCMSKRLASRPIRRHLTSTTRRRVQKSADDPGFVSIVDAPPQIISTRRKHSKIGITILALIPIISFGLGSWQVQRLDWKTKLIAKFEDRLIKSPLPLPPRIDPEAIADFDYRRVYATGILRHDREMLIGPRMHDGNDGYLVVTPLEREDGSTILVSRGWISKDKKYQRERDPSALPRGEITVSGLLREPWKKNLFTPNNKPEEGKFYFPDVYQMARVSGAEPVWIEETMTPSLLEAYDREAKGRPIGRAAEVNLRNNHAQYIFTWYAMLVPVRESYLINASRYSLSAATAIMMWMVFKKKPSGIERRVRTSKEW